MLSRYPEKEHLRNSIAIPLSNFSYLHHTHGLANSRVEGNYLGRKKEIFEFAELLDATETVRGAYLISGYRG